MQPFSLIVELNLDLSSHFGFSNVFSVKAVQTTSYLINFVQSAWVCVL